MVANLVNAEVNAKTIPKLVFFQEQPLKLNHICFFPYLITGHPVLKTAGLSLGFAGLTTIGNRHSRIFVHIRAHKLAAP